MHILEKKLKNQIAYHIQKLLRCLKVSGSLLNDFTKDCLTRCLKDLPFLLTMPISVSVSYPLLPHSPIPTLPHILRIHLFSHAITGLAS